MGTVHTFPHDDDATPTTRFIRNCEAVGLFNDLPPNPFEETFRMATANDLPDSLKDSPLKVNTEETLNTPRVISSSSNQSFQSLGPVIDDDEDIIVLNDLLEPILPETPHIPSSQNDINSNDSSDVEIIENSHPVSSIITKSVPASNSNSNINFENIIFAISDSGGKNGNVGGFLLEPSTSQTTSNSFTVNFAPNKEFILQKPFVPVPEVEETGKSKSTITFTPSVTTKPVNMVKNPNIVYKLAGTNFPAILSGKNVVILPSKSSSTNVETNYSKIVSRPNSDAGNQNDDNVKQKLRNLLRNSSSSQNIETSMTEELLEASRDSNSVSSVEDDKREYSRERNRMAQKRCRLKKKRYFMQLKNETENALSDNRKLGSLVHSLQAEIAHLKTLLLAHRNCSVTRAMYKADLNDIMNNEVSKIAEDIEIPASDDTDGLSSPMQITYRQNYSQVQNQHVKQVNHFHVHVPASPETSNDQQLLNFAPDPNLFTSQPFTFSRQMNVLSSKINSNKKLICDSKVVPIRSNDRIPKKAANLSTSLGKSGSPLSQLANSSRKPALKIYINGNEASLSETAEPKSSSPSTADSTVTSSSRSSSSLNISTGVIKSNANSRT